MGAHPNKNEIMEFVHILKKSYTPRRNIVNLGKMSNVVNVKQELAPADPRRKAKHGNNSFL